MRSEVIVASNTKKAVNGSFARCGSARKPLRVHNPMPIKSGKPTTTNDKLRANDESSASTRLEGLIRRPSKPATPLATMINRAKSTPNWKKLRKGLDDWPLEPLEEIFRKTNAMPRPVSNKEMSDAIITSPTRTNTSATVFH